MSCGLDFVGNDFKTLIQENIQSTIVHSMKNFSPNFVPIVTEKIQRLFQGWLFTARKEAAKGNFYADLSSFVVNDFGQVEHFYLAKSCIKLVLERFSEKTQSVIDNLSFSKVDESNTLLPGLILKSRFFSFRCFWIPENLIIRIPPRISGLLIEAPDSNSLMHFEAAKKGQGTDFRIEGTEDASLCFHKSYLTFHSVYFSAFFRSQSNFSEVNQSVLSIGFSGKSIENMRQFIYQGDIDPSYQKNLTELLELMDLSYQLSMDRLREYAIEIFFEYENSHYLEIEDLKKCMFLGLLYDNKELIDSCLHAAEKRERKEGSVAMDWTDVPPKYYSQLLLQSASIQCDLTAKKLKECIDAVILDP